MKLTKLQRHTAYIILLVEAKARMRERKFFGGFCALIRDTFGFNDNEETVNGIYKWAKYNISYFKELQSKKPENTGSFWFFNNEEGWQKRIELLKKCINETA